MIDRIKKQLELHQYKAHAWKKINQVLVIYGYQIPNYEAMQQARLKDSELDKFIKGDPNIQWWIDQMEQAKQGFIP